MLYETLKHKKDIARLFSLGKVLSDKNMRLLVYTHKDMRSIPSVLFAMSKKLAHKPMRNKQIRRMRAIVKNDPQEIQPAYDIAIMIKNATASFYELQNSYYKIISRIRYTKDKRYC